MWKFNVQIQENCNQNILYELFCSNKLMLEYLIESGKEIPDWIGKDLQEMEKDLAQQIKTYKITPAEKETEVTTKDTSRIEDYTDKIVKMYKELASLSEPASPKTLRDTSPVGKMFFRFGNPCIPFMRNLWIMSIVFLVAFIITGYLNAYHDSTTLLQQLFLVFSAGLGAYFYSLYTVRRYIVNRTFDDRYTSHYYNRIIMGILAGYILANFMEPSSINQENNKLVMKLTPSLFALVGGFSSDAVVKILNRIVAMLTALVEGEMKDIIETKEQEIKNKNELTRIRNNSEVVLELSSLVETNIIKQDQALQDKIKELIKKLLK